MMNGIPSVKTWLVTVVDNGKDIARFEVLSPTKKLAKIGFRLDYPRFWGLPLKIGLKRNA